MLVNDSLSVCHFLIVTLRCQLYGCVRITHSGGEGGVSSLCHAGPSREHKTHFVQAKQHATIMAGVWPQLNNLRCMLQWDSIHGRWVTVLGMAYNHSCTLLLPILFTDVALRFRGRHAGHTLSKCMLDDRTDIWSHWRAGGWRF